MTNNGFWTKKVKTQQQHKTKHRKLNAELLVPQSVALPLDCGDK